MKSVLERTETVSLELHRLELKELKLISIKVVADHPDTGHFRIRSLLKENEFIEIFEFFFSGNLLKYSYSYVKDDKPILKYDNAPHHPEIQTHPHHKHLKNEIQPLKKPNLTEFINEINKL